MKIEILGTGCPRCEQLAKNVKQAADELNLAVEIEKVTEIKKILDYGVIMTPGLAVDGEVKVSGKLLTVDEIKGILGA